MENEQPTIKEFIDGITFSTENSYCFHTHVSISIDKINNKTVHRRMIQSLYQEREKGIYFIAFWNKPLWDDKFLQFTYTNEITIIDVSLAKQWVKSYCQDKERDFNSRIESKPKSTSSTAVNLRMPSELRDYMLRVSKLTGVSLNKICVDMINSGISFGNAISSIRSPSSCLEMPNGEPALDENFIAREFEDPDDNELAAEAEYLHFCFIKNELHYLLPHTLHVLYNLFQIKHDVKRATCYAIWLSYLHKISFYETPRHPREIEYGEWHWIEEAEGRWSWVKYEIPELPSLNIKA